MSNPYFQAKICHCCKIVHLAWALIWALGFTLHKIVPPTIALKTEVKYMNPFLHCTTATTTNSRLKSKLKELGLHFKSTFFPLAAHLPIQDDLVVTRHNLGLVMCV
jgi:hypothetical protein